ncbi:MFS transporter [Halomonas sp. SpR8]|uniref:MFS transporter n=1 Tax=Halomonas sp. SpR8 TaxID=3050463 RepID=UPI0027E410C8|nr:MFS transporter [Halomonas sp. SpR8]MDQ7727883.1 MFS transporter [Halomonas sp. SpR8]
MPRQAAAWKVNLWVTGSGSFINIVAMTIMLPFLPHYLGNLGDYSEGETWVWSSLVYASTFLTAALFAPLWGRLSDIYGCKINLVRASVGMLVCMTLMGLATSVWQMVILRLLTGVAGGYTSGATILMAKEAPESRAGHAQGVLFACILAGSLAGPLLGGFISARLGMREAFFITGSMILLNVIATLFLVKEQPTPQRSRKEGKAPAAPFDFRIWALLIATLGLLVANLSIEPIIASVVEGVYHAPLETTLAAGIVLSATALGSLFSALTLGRLADRYGAMRVAAYSFSLGALLILPQAFVTDVYTLTGLRFAMGLALGGVLPCLKSALKHAYPDAGSLGRVMGVSTSFQYIGQVVGPLMGGVVAASWGIHYAFYATAAAAALCALLITISRRHLGEPVPA